MIASYLLTGFSVGLVIGAVVIDQSWCRWVRIQTAHLKKIAAGQVES